MSEHQVTAGDADEETLRPFLWLRRLVAGSVVVLVLLAALRRIAGHVAERRWHATANR